MRYPGATTRRGNSGDTTRPEAGFWVRRRSAGVLGSPPQSGGVTGCGLAGWPARRRGSAETSMAYLN